MSGQHGGLNQLDAAHRVCAAGVSTGMPDQLDILRVRVLRTDVDVRKDIAHPGLEQRLEPLALVRPRCDDPRDTPTRGCKRRCAR